MDIRFHNSLTKKIEPFTPISPELVRMYSCGPTVYDYAHIGNFRSFLFADLLRRFLEATGTPVLHVMNITDVGHMTDDAHADGAGEDKMQVAARRIKEGKKSGTVEAGTVENPDDPYQIAAHYRKAFLDDGKALGLKVADEFPQNVLQATEHIPEMIALIEKLIARDHAYVGGDGVVYFSVESFPEYGKLSGNTLEQLQEGAGGRVDENDQAAKRHPADFMLWKRDASHVMKWDSPWGQGYPGWHIECSAMAMHRHGVPVIDIHTGGEDLIFPHHECEIAQSCGGSGESSFARFWMHARFLLVEGKKMSKREGNFYTVRDVLGGKVTGRPVHPSVLRYELIKSHYRANMNFTLKGLADSGETVRKWTEFGERIAEAAAGQAAPLDRDHPVLKEFLAALADDLNISAAMAVLYGWMGTPITQPAESLAAYRVIDSVLGMGTSTQAKPSTESDPAVDLCKQIDDARKAKDFAAADRFRKQLIDLGYEVRSSPTGTVARKLLV